ncbi:serine/threonine-protein kinase [Streptomyces sp. NRRL S-31]|uniref:serine/threonine-protein kinase n=1 Tax=Streptomyces sp. NRRL S-31 TaxID=1463898 RepID=UPI0004CB6751|nr:serine/threonine-protein kinase [Streptomyces sp. NRRL S-31]
MTEDGEHPPGARLIGGRYRLAGRLGSGPTGTVWRARDEQGRGYVAVKEPLLPGDPATDEESRRVAHRLHHEARAATRVRHPSAVTVYDVVTEDGVPWIVMELVAGESLGEVLRRGPLPAAEAARVGLAVLGALRAAHAVGIVHRDVKPANVLLESGTGRVVLTDFGIGDGHAGDAPAGFVAPERAAGPGAGPASDLWSLGALLRTAVGDADPGPLGPLLDRLHADDPAARPGAAEVTAVLGAVLGRTAEAEPSVPGPRPVPDPAPVTAPGPTSEAAPGTTPDATPDESAPGTTPDTTPESAPGAAPDPTPDEPAPGTAPGTTSAPAPEPRRRTPLTALGLLLTRKPEID